MGGFTWFMLGQWSFMFMRYLHMVGLISLCNSLWKVKEKGYKKRQEKIVFIGKTGRLAFAT